MCVNALNGLSSFLLSPSPCQDGSYWVCQRPKRALFISTNLMEDESKREECQRPKRALFISTMNSKRGQDYQQKCVNALNGLSSFLQNLKEAILWQKVSTP